MRNYFQNRERTIVFFIAVLTPFICTVILLLSQGLWFNSVSICCSDWNDELIYFKQIEAMIDFGHPLGYYGYSETHAVIGTYAAWGPIVLLPYVFWGKVFGWTFASPIIMHVLWVTFAFVLYAILLKPSIEQQIFMSLLFLSNAVLIRYMISTTPESMLLALSMIYCILVYRVIREEDSLALRIICYIIMMYITMAKGYYAIFSVLMMVALLKRKKYLGFVVQITTLLIAVCAFFYIFNNASAPYFGSTLDTSSLMNPSVLIDVLKTSFLESQMYVKNAILYRTSIRGSWYAGYIILGLVLIIALLIKRNIYYLTSLGMWIVLLLALWGLYNATEGSRQLMNCTFIGLVFVTHDLYGHNYQRVINIAIIVVVACLFWLSRDAFYRKLPEKNPSLMAEIEQLDLSESMPASDNKWDNTVIWTLSCPFNLLYALPSGFGINCCLDKQVLECYDELRSKYVAVLNEGEVDLFLKDHNCNVIAQYGSIKVYLLR